MKYSGTRIAVERNNVYSFLQVSDFLFFLLFYPDIDTIPRTVIETHADVYSLELFSFIENKVARFLFNTLKIDIRLIVPNFVPGSQSTVRLLQKH